MPGWLAGNSVHYGVAAIQPVFYFFCFCVSHRPPSVGWLAGDSVHYGVAILQPVFSFFCFCVPHRPPSVGWLARDSLPICLWANRKVAMGPFPVAQQPTGLLDLDGSSPWQPNKKTRYPDGYLVFWWLARDSNPGPTP